jgi:hypothetical protein
MVRCGVRKSVQTVEADIRQRTEHWKREPTLLRVGKTAEEISDSLANYGAIWYALLVGNTDSRSLR